MGTITSAGGKQRETRQRAKNGARPSQARYLSAWTRRSQGNSYSQSASVASNCGGFARQLPQTDPSGVGSAQRGQCAGSSGSACAQAAHTSSCPLPAPQSAQSCPSQFSPSRPQRSSQDS